MKISFSKKIIKSNHTKGFILRCGLKFKPPLEECRSNMLNMSPLYGIFIPKRYAFCFVLDAYFSSSVRAHNYLITQIRKGTKNTINITNDVFLEKEIFLPTSEEEAKKIQAFVELLDKQIQIEKDKLETIKVSVISPDI